MSSRSLARRLKRLEAELTSSAERVLTIEVTFVGQPDRNRTIELRMPEATGRGRQPWQKNEGRRR